MLIATELNDGRPEFWLHGFMLTGHQGSINHDPTDYDQNILPDRRMVSELFERVSVRRSECRAITRPYLLRLTIRTEGVSRSLFNFWEHISRGFGDILAKGRVVIVRPLDAATHIGGEIVQGTKWTTGPGGELVMPGIYVVIEWQGPSCVLAAPLAHLPTPNELAGLMASGLRPMTFVRRAFRVSSRGIVQYHPRHPCNIAYLKPENGMIYSLLPERPEDTRLLAPMRCIELATASHDPVVRWLGEHHEAVLRMLARAMERASVDDDGNVVWADDLMPAFRVSESQALVMIDPFGRRVAGTMPPVVMGAHRNNGSFVIVEQHHNSMDAAFNLPAHINAQTDAITYERLSKFMLHERDAEQARREFAVRILMRRS